MINHKPLIVQLSITNRCQCKCKHCGVSFIRDKEELTMAEIKSLLLDLKSSGTEVIDLFGGEPTLRKDLFEIIRLGKENGFQIILETNGILFNDEYVLRLKKSGLDEVFVSLDHYLPHFHDQNRGFTGAFEKAVNAIFLCKKYGLTVKISTVPLSEDYFTNGEINNFIRFCVKKGADRIRILLPKYVGSAKLNNDSHFLGDSNYLVSYIEKSLLPYIFFDSEDTPLTNVEQCSAKRDFCHIKSNGDVMPCPYLPIVFGNIKKESIGVIFQRIRKNNYMKMGGKNCLARNEKFLRKHLNLLDEKHPYYKEKDGKIRIVSAR